MKPWTKGTEQPSSISWWADWFCKPNTYLIQDKRFRILWFITRFHENFVEQELRNYEAQTLGNLKRHQIHTSICFDPHSILSDTKRTMIDLLSDSFSRQSIKDWDSKKFYSIRNGFWLFSIPVQKTFNLLTQSLLEKSVDFFGLESHFIFKWRTRQRLLKTNILQVTCTSHYHGISNLCFLEL